VNFGKTGIQYCLLFCVKSNNDCLKTNNADVTAAVFQEAVRTASMVAGFTALFAGYI